MNLSSIALPTASGTTLDFGSLNSTPAVLILSNQRTTDLARSTEKALHSSLPTSEVSVIQIAHLTGVPRLVRKLVERDLRRNANAQRDALLERRAAQGLASSDVTLLLETVLDWQGEVTTLLGFSDADQRPFIAVLHDDATVHPIAYETETDVVMAVTGAVTPGAR